MPRLKRQKVCAKCGKPMPKRDRGFPVPTRNEAGVIEQRGSCCAFPALEKEISANRELRLAHNMPGVWMDRSEDTHNNDLARFRLRTNV